MNKLQRLILISSIAIASTMPAAALAQNNIVGGGGGIGGITSDQAGVPTRFGTFENIIKTTFNIVILVSGIIFVVLMLLGGVEYLTSLGVEDNATKARKLMLNGLIGLIIVLTSFAIGTYVLQLLGFGNQSGTLNTGTSQTTGGLLNTR